MRALLILTALGVVGAGLIAGRSSREFEAQQTARIRSHFDSVLTELAIADVSRLSEQQRSRRAMMVVALKGYRDRGVFPHNYDFAEPTPQFIDRMTGARCAMAFLLELTGRRLMVARIARADNSVRIADLAGDSTLATWLEENGLTIAEAARIQPTYGPPSPPPPAKHWDPASAAPVTLAAAGTAVALNLVTNREGKHAFQTAVGYVAGGAALVVGVFSMVNPTDSRTRNHIGLGVANGVVGMGSVLLSSAIQKNRRGSKGASTAMYLVPNLPTPKSGVGIFAGIRVLR